MGKHPSGNEMAADWGLSRAICLRKGAELAEGSVAKGEVSRSRSDPALIVSSSGAG